MNTIGKYVALALLLLLSGASGARAVDETGNFVVLGIGGNTCGKYLSEEKPIKAYYDTWLTGYVTALNRKTPGSANILSKTDLARAMGWIANYCRENPTENFHDAAAHLVTFLLEK